MEIGVEYSVAREDVNAFERYMAMLKTYYMDYADKLEESPKKYELLGLNLLRLLSQNETAKFHTEIELLDPLTIQENPYISCPVKLEQDIMEGSYKKVSSVLFKFCSRNIKKLVKYSKLNNSMDIMCLFSRLSISPTMSQQKHTTFSCPFC